MFTQSWWGEDLLAQGADSAPWAAAGTEISMGRLRAETSWLANLFRHHGIGPGSTVAFRGVPSFTQLWSLFACWSLGAQVILLERWMAGPELAALLDEYAPQFVITFGDLPSPYAFVDECAVMVSRRRAGRPATTPHCLIQFSSGTTKGTKAVGRTPESLLHELARIHELDGLPEPGEPLLLLDSVTSSFGLIGGLLRALDVGYPVLVGTGRRPAAVMRTAAAAGVIIGTPRQFRTLNWADGPEMLPRLRTAVSYGDVLPSGVGERFAQRYRVEVGQAYGTTETGLIAVELAGQFPTPHIGRPVPGMRTRINDGVLEVHLAESPYPYQEDLSRGGWLSTHDLVSQDPATRMLRLRGRFVPTGTDRAMHADLLRIETVLRMHDRVGAAVVVGGGDELEAHVAGSNQLDQGELAAWCKRFLDEDAIPTRYHLLSSLPTTGNGKFVRGRELLLAHGSRIRAGKPTK